MKRILLWGMILLLSLALISCSEVPNGEKTSLETQTKTEENANTPPVTPPVTDTETGETETETEPETEEPETEEPETGETTTPPPQTTTPPQVTMSKTLFIGDSRTDGLRLYSGMKGVDYFCATSMTVFGVQSASCDVPGMGNMTLSALLELKDYERIYVLLGINEIYRGADSISAKFGELLTLLREKESAAKLFVLANIHVTAERSAKGDAINNDNIKALNEKLSALCDNENIFFIDSNILFTDENGNLIPYYTWDGVHFNASPYKTWAADIDQQTRNYLGQ